VMMCWCDCDQSWAGNWASHAACFFPSGPGACSSGLERHCSRASDHRFVALEAARVRTTWILPTSWRLTARLPAFTPVRMPTSEVYFNNLACLPIGLFTQTMKICVAPCCTTPYHQS
jgi:hypothetical protein